MWYVARTFALFTLLPILATGCSLRILGVDKNSLATDGTDASVASGNSNDINAFSVLGATGGSDTSADAYLADGTTVTARWVDTTGEDSYEVKILDSSGSTTLCGPTTIAEDSESHTFSGCALSHGTTYRIQVTAKNSKSNAAHSAYSNFQVGPFITVSNLSVNEWGIASIPVSLSYAVGSSVSVQYVTVDSSASSGTDYHLSPLSTLAIPAGQTVGMISVPIFTDRNPESSEQFRIELSAPSGAGLMSSSALVTLQDDDAAPATGFTQVSAGDSHNCGLTSAGGVKCWGYNFYGQIGDNSTVSRPLPADVSGLSSSVTQITAGFSHSCALTSTGAVKCWGRNLDGQLGDNTGLDRLVPADATNLSSGVTQVVAGSRHTCAITSAGAVKCWGRNTFGQLGDGTFTNRLVPVDVSGLSSGVTQIAADSNGNQTCALLTTGAVKCWGANSSGQLGDNTTTNRIVPTDVSGLSSGVTQIVAGGIHTCALLSSGGVKCWGNNTSGELGDNTTTSRIVPTDVSGLSLGVAQITAGGTHSCALLSNDTLQCWGLNSSGQLGDNSTTNRLIPTDVSGLSSGITQIAAGGTHSCALLSNGTLQCWGSNFFGQIGDNSSVLRQNPTDVAGLSSGITQVIAGNTHTCALTSAGAVKCWGSNLSGQIGDNTTTSRPLPTDVWGLSSNITQVTAGGAHSCALTSGGAVKCWGSNTWGQIGDNTTMSRFIPTDVSGLFSGITQITAGNTHTCALTSAGAVKCWGSNFTGQIGDNSTIIRLIPTDVSTLSSGVAQITTGTSHTCALLSTGAVKCWGSNSSGQIGDNSTTPRIVPTDVSGLTSGVTQIAAGSGHTCALLSTGAVKCWGLNSSGQVGDNSTTDRLVPTDVSGPASEVTQIAPCSSHTCALLSTGAVRCWGLNSSGQVGDNSTTNRLVPTDVSGLASGVTRIAGGGNHSCALTFTGEAKCWGSHSAGQIGDSYTNQVPQFVISPE